MSAISDLGELRALASQWRRLAETRSNAFVTPEWFFAYFKHYGELDGDGASPFVPAVLDSAGDLRGLLPLAISTAGHPRVCRIAGSNLGDHFVPVCGSGDEEAVAIAAGEALAAARDRWSVLTLEGIDAEASWPQRLREASGLRLAALSRPPVELPLIDLAAHGGWEDYLSGRSANFRQQVRRFGRRIARDHEVTARRTESAGEFDRDMDTFFELHDRRWAGRGGSSFPSDAARGLHRDFARSALERGWLRLWLLELDGEAAAAWYGWRIGGRYTYYNSGFDPAREGLSPGLVLLSRVIESAFEEGASEFDFLAGDERYKFRFADAAREVTELTLTRPLPHPAALVARAEHTGRRIGRMIPPETRRKLGLASLARRSMLRGRRR